MPSNTSTLDELLFESCQQLQISPTLHAEATKHYHVVAAWLGAEGSELAQYDPQIYPQGSFLIGTTTRPIFDEEFDLDFVLELALNTHSSCPLALLDSVENRLREHKKYAPMVERLKRCVRLNYAGSFHMDILPAAPEQPRVGTRILVPDRKLEEWKESDPKGFAAWFSEKRVSELLEKAAEVEPVPHLQEVDDKTPLQRCVQLVKRARDKFFGEANDMDSSPRSIVLSKLAGDAYGGERSTAQALHRILGALVADAQTSLSPPTICNPANPAEIFSEHWLKEPEAYEKYRAWIFALNNAWDHVLACSTISDAQEHLNELFGEELVKSSFRKHAERVEELRKSGKLRVSAAGGLTTIAGATPIRQNEFYGKA